MYNTSITQQETTMSTIPKGYCRCGCGGKTSIAKQSNNRGAVRGEPMQYLRGHHLKRGDTRTRFIEKIEVRASGCHEWSGARDTCGYGQFWTGRDFMRAHRYVWEQNFGPIPEGLLVLHRCDNPPCVNPAHLFLGTQKDNMQDRVRKGRVPRGWKLSVKTRKRQARAQLGNKKALGCKQTEETRLRRCAAQQIRREAERKRGK